MVVTVHHTASIQCHLLLVILSVFSFNIIAAKTTHTVIVTGPWHEGRHIIITTYMMNVFHAFASASLYLYTFMCFSSTENMLGLVCLVIKILMK